MWITQTLTVFADSRLPNQNASNHVLIYGPSSYKKSSVFVCKSDCEHLTKVWKERWYATTEQMVTECLDGKTGKVRYQ